MAGLGEVFASCSGWLKIVELVFTFITLLLHRLVSRVCSKRESFKNSSLKIWCVWSIFRSFPDLKILQMSLIEKSITFFSIFCCWNNFEGFIIFSRSFIRLHGLSSMSLNNQQQMILLLPSNVFYLQ